MLKGLIPTLGDLQRLMLTTIPSARFRYSNLYNTTEQLYGENRRGRILADNPEILPFQAIKIDQETKNEAKLFTLGKDIPYYAQHNEIDELYHWIDGFAQLSALVPSITAEDIITRLQHPILVYSAITQLLVETYKHKFGEPQTKTLLENSCVKWDKTMHHPIRKWGRVYLNRRALGLGPSPWSGHVFSTWIQQYYTPEVEVTPENFLQSYSSRATEKFDFKYGKKPAYTLALGVELELENLTKKAIPVLTETLGQHAIFKRDGSVRGGVEICTAPATLDLHKDTFKTFFEQDSGLKVKENCGLHVHVDRKGLEKTQIPKILMFMNHPDNNELIERIAGRKANSYCRTNPYNWESAIQTARTDNTNE